MSYEKNANWRVLETNILINYDTGTQTSQIFSNTPAVWSLKTQWTGLKKAIEILINLKKQIQPQGKKKEEIFETIF